ncbi:hypothetical protein [Salidesulfovibrio onnuriiensis]|uniref:hypothetical protein n=1 Tax=Salidesulfovibrio onnuriiensis TaxID=2583823 RepID=UPI0011CBBFD9|nr:hypothetical protein [Salidesulfovibrio onnuriiensis]
MFEFFQTADALEKAGINVRQRDASLKPCPNKPRVIVYLNEDGAPVGFDLAERPGNGNAMIERWAPDNHKAFPTFAVDPVFVAESAHLSSLKKVFKDNDTSSKVIRGAVNGLKESAVPAWSERLAKKLNRQFTMGESLLESASALSEEAAPFIELVRRAALIDYYQFQQFLCESIMSGLAEFPLGWRYHVDACFGQTDKSVTPNTLLVSLELDDWHVYAYPANSPAMFDILNDGILGASASQTGEVDAFGLPLEGYEAPMPKILLPKSGEKPMRSMFSDVPANFRYHRAGADSFPVGSQSRLRMLAAAKWITAPEREGRTWAFLTQKIKVGRSEIQPTIVVIAPQDMPEVPPAFGALFAPLSERAKEVAEVTKYGEVAKIVADAISGAWQGDLSVPINVSVITSYDKGRYKLLMSESYTAEHMLESARRWNEGCANIPLLRYRVQAKKKAYSISPVTPAPSEIISLLSNVWLRSGTEVRATRQVAQELPALLLLASGQQEHDIAVALLTKHVSDQEAVLIALGPTLLRNRELVLPTSDRNAYHHLEILPSILGLLLLKAGRKMEEYMQDSYFLVGRLMSLADTLHEQYCKGVRGGDLPSSLLGNSLMRVALANPVDAFDQLADRILVYHSWARTNRSEESRLAKWTLGLFSEVSEALKQKGVPDMVNSTGKAEMLLGYLAGFPRKNNNSTDTNA